MRSEKVYQKDNNKCRLHHVVSYELIKFTFSLFSLSLGFAYVTAYEDEKIKVKQVILPLATFTFVYEKIKLYSAQ